MVEIRTILVHFLGLNNNEIITPAIIQVNGESRKLNSLDAIKNIGRILK